MLATKEKIQVNLSEDFKTDIVTYSIRIPSGDNVQPFRLSFQDDLLKIFHDKTISKHELNYKERSSLITYGCLKKIIDIICSHHNLKPIFNELMLEDVNVSHWAIVSFEEEEREPVELKKEIHSRLTHRGAYKDMPKETINDIQAKLFNDFKIVKISKKQAKELALNDQNVWKSKIAVSDLMNQVNLFKYENYGLNFNNLYMPYANILNLFLAKLFPSFGKVLFPIVKQVVTSLFMSSSSILVYKKDLDKKEDYIEMGEDCYHQWLELTKMGYYLQPMTTSSSPLLCASHKFEELNDHETSKRFIERYHEMSHLLGVDGNIGWLFRIGVPKSKDVPSLRINEQEFTSVNHLYDENLKSQE